MKNSKIYYFITLISLLVTLFLSCSKEEENTSPPVTTVTDIDGNVYDIVTIGTQVWMKQNLKVTHYRNGDLIPNIKNSTEWAYYYEQYTGVGARCYYFNDSSIYASIYGAFYNHFAVMDSRGLAPTGWHIPSITEWQTLTTYLGSNSAGKLKEIGYNHWGNPNTGATNETGFTALPGGERNVAAYKSLGDAGYWWSVEPSSGHHAWYWCTCMSYDNGDVQLNQSASGSAGLSIRCIKD